MLPKYTRGEAQWAMSQLLIAPVLKDSPPDLGSAFAAHILWASDYGRNALYRGHNNLIGIPYSPDLKATYGAVRGQPDAYSRIARFPDLTLFVEAYLSLHAHLLKLPAKSFFAHMRKNDLTANAGRRWDRIEETWEKHFA